MTVARGDIRNSAYNSRAKHYMWGLMCEYFPRKISPTDVDNFIEMSNCFFLFEGKTRGKKIDTGQWLALKRLLLALPEGRAVLAVGTHSSLEVVDVKNQLDGAQFYWHVGGELQYSPAMREPSSLFHLCQLFQEDAESLGFLRCSTWFERWQRLAEPFEDGAA